MVDNSIIIDDVREIIKNVKLEKLDNKSILITGASGLIGTFLLFLLKEYIEHGGKPKSITGIFKNDTPKHLSDLYTDNESFKFITGDLTDYHFLNKLKKFDIIIHAAGYSQPQKFMQDSLSTIRLNSSTTDFLLTKLNKNGIFLFISSSELYMGSINSPHKVTDIGTTTPFHPRAPYIEGKRIGETITFAAQKRFIDAKIVRLSLLYGPGFKYDDSRVMFEFIKKASVGDIELLDDGKALRTYCYISDGIELIIRVLLDGEGYLYNIGGHSKVSILEIAELVAKEFNSKVIKGNKINHLNAPNIVEVDTSSTELEFNKTEYVGFSKGLAKTISWYKSNYLTNK